MDIRYMFKSFIWVIRRIWFGNLNILNCQLVQSFLDSDIDKVSSAIRKSVKSEVEETLIKNLIKNNSCNTGNCPTKRVITFKWQKVARNYTFFSSIKYVFNNYYMTKKLKMWNKMCFFYQMFRHTTKIVYRIAL